MKKFHICTIANKLKQYEEMKASFIEAGFSEDRCTYTIFDNSKGNIYEPYSTFNKIKSDTTEPYIIFCHQDILLDQGDGFEKLVELIEEMDNLDPKWSVLGNAGFNDNHQKIIRIKDPNNLEQWTGDFPQKVHDLDENFLVIKSNSNISSSPDLKGFHFYGSDLCLVSIKKGYSCYVINFYLTHLSPGNFDQVFWESCETFYEKWTREFNLYYVVVTGVPLLLTKHRIIRFLSKKQTGMQLILNCRKLYTRVTSLS